MSDDFRYSEVEKLLEAEQEIKDVLRIGGIGLARSLFPNDPRRRGRATQLIRGYMLRSMVIGVKSSAIVDKLTPAETTGGRDDEGH